MKKVLSMLLALAMVLTMASFPAFAADGDPATYTIKCLYENGVFLLAEEANGNSTTASDTKYSGVVGESVTISAPEIEGFTVVSSETLTKKLAADASNNIFVFRYVMDSQVNVENEVYIHPKSAEAYLDYEGGVIADPNGSNTVNKMVNQATGDYYQSAIKFVAANRNFTLIFDLGHSYNLTSFNWLVGSAVPTKAKISVSEDKTTWTKVSDYTNTDSDTTKISPAGNVGFYYEKELNATTAGRYVRIDVTGLSWDNNLVLREVYFKGTFAENNPKINITASSLTATPSMNNMDRLVDGFMFGENSTYVFNNSYKNSLATNAQNIVIDLGNEYDVTNLILAMGSKAWGYVPSQGYSIYVAGSDGEYGEAVYTLANTGNTASAQWRVDDLDLSGKADGVQYIKFVNDVNIYRLTFDEITVLGELSQMPAATYTVKYKSDDPNFVAPADKVVEGKHVGNKVTETAPEITGYTVDEATKSITLVDGTNEIVFTYTARPAATYTVEYVDAEGNPIADAKEVKTGFYKDDVITETAEAVAGYKPTETSREVTLAAGANTITFTYSVAESVTYTVKYVDALGNPIADAKTGEAYEGEVISENAPNFYAKGYFINGTDLTKKMELALDSDNEITFVYKKIIKVFSFTKTLLNGTQGLWDVNRMYNGEILGDYDQLNTTTTTEAPYAEMVFVLDGLYAIDKMTTYWGSNNANAVSIYVSMDGINWGDPVYAGESNDVKTTFVNGDASTAVYVAEFDLGDTLGQYVKYVVEDAPSGWLAIREFTFEGENLLVNEIELTEDNVISNKNFGAQVPGEGRLGSLGSMFDGEVATKGNSNWANVWYGETLADLINGTTSQGKPWNPNEFTIDLGGVYDLTYAALQGGLTGYGAPAPAGYDIYVAGIDGEFRLANSYVDAKYEIGDTLINDYVVKNVHEINEDNVRYVKVVITRASGRTAVGEFDVYGTKVDFAANPEKAAASLGGQIRLPAGSLSAGIRFGATIMKEAIEEGDTYGMFLLPAEMLDGNATLADYITNEGTEALDVPAARIYAEDDYSITFTAVLIGIPNTDYDTDIIAVPYIKKGDEYVFFAEMTRNYIQVATSVAASYEAGEITLTAEQITLIEDIIDRTLVVA